MEHKRQYIAPSVELVRLKQPLNLLVSVSMESGFEEWEEGDEI